MMVLLTVSLHSMTNELIYRLLSCGRKTSSDLEIEPTVYLVTE